ncbi:hypothetical protein NKH57_25635 [Mesorhizobium sp. M1050]|uniref:hypothetical protein n=1 Tax=Mesorhizobium sp. M1050 TaxID=2957051 RepID=UPI00333E11CB
MRIGEALRLVLHDVDLTEQIITVRDTKFFKTRLVPIGPKLNCELAAHIERRHLLPLPRGKNPRCLPRAMAGRGTMCGSFPGSSMSAEPPESVVLSESFGHHDCTIFVTRPPCIG